MSNNLKITKRSNLKGDDGYKVFSVRIKDGTVKSLEKIAESTNRSRNELINILLDYALEHVEIE